MSLKENGGVINKIYFVTSWSPISTPLILASASMKMASASASVIYNSIESGYPWRTPHTRVKRSDRRSFILILELISVYLTSIM